MWRPDHWDDRFLGLAEHIAQWSKDTTKVGAVIVDRDCSIVSLGFNGFPRGVKDDPARLEDRVTKWHITVHAERNAMLYAKRSLVGCVLYTIPCQPCSQCAAMIVQAGIRTVICRGTERTDEPFLHTRMIFQEAGVSLNFA